MPLVDLTSAPLPNDDENADATDVSLPIQAILAVINGHIDTTNMEPGGLAWSVMGTFTNQIPAAAMQNEGNVKLYRQETALSIIVSGFEWSTISGLNGTMTSGITYSTDGSRQEVPTVASRAFTASKDTYVDVSAAGSISYSEVANGATPPALASGYLRLAKVVTNGSAITSITDMRKLTINNVQYRKSTSGTTTSSTTDGAVSELVIEFTVERDNTVVEIDLSGVVNLPTGQSPASTTTKIWDGAIGTGTLLDTNVIQLATSNSSAIPIASKVFVTKNRGTHTFRVSFARTGGTASASYSLNSGTVFSTRYAS